MPDHEGAQFAARRRGSAQSQDGRSDRHGQVPGYDDNMFARGITQKEWDDLQNDLHRPLINHATSDNVPPGSTFKIVTAAALLEEGAMSRIHRDQRPRRVSRSRPV